MKNILLSLLLVPVLAAAQGYHPQTAASYTAAGTTGTSGSTTLTVTGLVVTGPGVSGTLVLSGTGAATHALLNGTPLIGGTSADALTVAGQTLSAYATGTATWANATNATNASFAQTLGSAGMLELGLNDAPFFQAQFTDQTIFANLRFLSSGTWVFPPAVTGTLQLTTDSIAASRLTGTLGIPVPGANVAGAIANPWTIRPAIALSSTLTLQGLSFNNTGQIDSMMDPDDYPWLWILDETFKGPSTKAYYINGVDAGADVDAHIYNGSLNLGSPGGAWMAPYNGVPTGGIGWVGPRCFVETTFLSSSSTGVNQLCVGYSYEDSPAYGNYAYFYYNVNAAGWGVYDTLGGGTLVSGTGSFSFPLSMRMIITGTACGVEIAQTATNGKMGAYQLLGTAPIALPDMRNPATLNNVHPLLGVTCATGSATISAFRAGYFLGGGVQNPYGIHYDDGAPIHHGPWYYFMANDQGPTIYGAGDGNGCTQGQGYWAMRYNVVTKKIEPVSLFFCTRSGTTVYSADNAGTAVFDRQLNQWEITAPTFSDFCTANYYTKNYLYQTQDDILQNGVYVLKNGTAMSLPGYSGTTTTYNADLLRLSSTSVACAYTLTNGSNSYSMMYAALASGTSYSGPWSQVGIGTQKGENAHFVTVGGTNYVMNNNPYNSGFFTYPMAATSGTLVATGTTTITNFGNSYTAPWIFPVSTQGTTQWMALGFGSLWWGELGTDSMVTTAASVQSETGEEFDLRRIPLR